MTLLPVVVFDDVELWTTARLRTLLAARPEAYAAGVFVGNKVPSVRRDRMVTVRDDGGPRLDVVRKAARIGVNVWGRTDQEVNDLARLVEALLWASPDGNPVSKVGVTSPLPVADDSGQPRRYLTAELTVRGRTA